MAGLGAALALLLAPLPATAITHRYALSVFHFNIQYVAGGLIGLFTPPCSLWELDAEAVEDSIVIESFEPILDLFLRHPEWGTNLEMQAYFIEVLAKRHPGVLEKLQALGQSGQVEIVSFHYADQFFIAYPRADLERSLKMTRQVFADFEIPLGRSVFCQEGQAAPGMTELMRPRGYEVLIWPKNLYRYQHGTPEPVMPLYSLGDLWMVLGAQPVDFLSGDERIQVEWTFFDDGEKLATNDMDPYFPPFFRHDPAAVAEYEARLLELQEQGYRITTVQNYLDDVRDLGFPAADPGPLLEGTWQPDSTDGAYRWLGGPGLFASQERDNYVRTLCAATHRELLAALTMLETLTARGVAADHLTAAMREAWRLLLLAQVSDSSGINPFRGEVDYGIAHAAEALRIGRELIDEGKRVLGYGRVAIDTSARLVHPETMPAETFAPCSDGPVSVGIEAPGREATTAWSRSSQLPGLCRLDLSFSPAQGAEARLLRACFEGHPDDFIYCPSLSEETPVTRRRTDFVWEHFVLPLPNGLIGLREGRFLIKDTAMVHVGAFLYADSPQICFQDETAPVAESVTWRFYVFNGEVEKAVSFANRLNVWPTLQR